MHLRRIADGISVHTCRDARKGNRAATIFDGDRQLRDIALLNSDHLNIPHQRYYSIQTARAILKQQNSLQGLSRFSPFRVESSISPFIYSGLVALHRARLKRERETERKRRIATILGLVFSPQRKKTPRFYAAILRKSL